MTHISSELFARGVEIVRPYLYLSGQDTLKADAVTINRGISLLQQACEHRADYWHAHWFLGKAFEAIGDYQASARGFREAFHLNASDRNVVHEYLVSLLRVHQSSEANEVIAALDENWLLSDFILRFDVALVRYFSRQFRESLNLLNTFEWPEQSLGRVNALKEKLEYELVTVKDTESPIAPTGDRQDR